jgi:hypothetical protein
MTLITERPSTRDWPSRSGRPIPVDPYIRRVGLLGAVKEPLYPMLHRMRRAGWLTSHPEGEQSWLAGAPPGRGLGGRRTYYNLIPERYRAACHELDRCDSHKDSPQPLDSIAGSCKQEDG